MGDFGQRVADDLGGRTNGTSSTPDDPFESARIDWSTFWDASHQQNDWLVEPLIARGRGHTLYAPGKAGKSLFLLDVAARLATGRAVLDQPAGAPTNVLYADLEMTPDDVRERLLEMGYGPAVDLSHLHYYALPSLSPLDTASGGHEIEELAIRHHAELVVIDTLSRVLAGPENDADTMTSFFRYTGLPLKARGVALMRADHAGKDPAKGLRGSSGKTNDIDVVWQMTRRDRGRFDLRATHKRMNWVPEQIHLELQDNPLQHHMVHDSWPAGTKETADLLDQLDVPVEESRRKAGAALREAGHAASNVVLAAAMRHRRNRVCDPSDLFGKRAP